MTLGVWSLLVIYSFKNESCVFLAFIIRLLTPSIPAGLHSDLLIYLNPPAGSLLGAFRLCAASQHLDGITTWLCQLVLAHLPWLV